jgi:hypothetical protein
MVRSPPTTRKGSLPSSIRISVPGSLPRPFPYMARLLLHLALFLLFTAFYGVAAASKTATLQAPLWNHNLWKDKDVLSYITNPHLDDNNHATETEGRNLVSDLLKVIHTSQHPPKSACRTTRLLIIHMKTESLEGLCSLVKQLTMGLSAAIHSNRTLVWGIYSGQFMFEATRDVWAGPKRDNIQLGRMRISCPKGENPLGGPFECFFQPLSSCTLDDITPQELLDLQSNPYDDTQRVKLMPVKVNGPRSVALYHPPYGLIDHIVKTYPAKVKVSMKTLLKSSAGHLWASSVVTYIFRLKSDLLSQFSSKYRSRFVSGQPVWGLHVRHGDVKSFHHFIRQKRVFSFESYFAVARDLSHRLNATPATIFVSTDSVRADEIPDLFDDFNIEDDDVVEDDEDKDDDDYYDEDDDEDEIELEEDEEDLDPQHTRWYGGRSPQIFTVNNTDRYRTEHGFVIAAAENCVDAVKRKGRKFCHVPHQFPVDVDGSVYDGKQQILEADRSVRLMRMLLEAVEDLYLLSLSDVIVAQGSSHFSTSAVMLMWARTGARNLDLTAQFLDIDSMISGDSASAFLQGTNLWNSSYVGPGEERWRIHTYRFISGLPMTDITGTISVPLSYDPWSPEMRMRMVHYLPQLPEAVFYRESKQWLGHSSDPVFPGRCIQEVNHFDEALITILVNIGADHFQYMHANEAQRCWTASLAAASKFKGRSSMMDVIMEISAGNLAAILQEAREYAYLAQQRGADPASVNKINLFANTANAMAPSASPHMPENDDDDDYYDEDVDAHAFSPSVSSNHIPTHDANRRSHPTQASEVQSYRQELLKRPGNPVSAPDKTNAGSDKLRQLNKIIKKVEKLELELQLLKLELLEYKDDFLE